MENQESQKDQFEKLFERTGAYIDTRLSLYKLKFVQKSSEVIASVITKIAVLLVFLVFFMLFHIGLAIYLGEILGKIYYGFFLLSGLYLGIALILYGFRDKIFKEPILNKVIAKFL